jgi:LDH2 family malate/lactate/ureidoglycolate dehydrogenase
MTENIRISYAHLVEGISTALERAGVPSSLASVEAEVMAESDLMGVASHGVRMLPALLQGFAEGRANPAPNITIIKEHGAMCMIDGDHGPGRYISVYAMQLAVEHAKQFGIGACLAVRASHWGRAFAYAERATREGMIGICTTNAIPNMVAWNSSLPLLGNNPLAIGVPRKGSHPIILDMAMSQAAMGKIGTYQREGKPTPDGWGLDSDGKPTNDPQAILSSKRILPFGDHKGAGLAVMMELLTGALSGGMLSREIAQHDASGLDSDASKLFIALDVNAFGSEDQLAAKIEWLAQWLHTTEPTLDISFPGEHSWQTREENLRNGIPLHPVIIEQLSKIHVYLK